MDKNSIQDRITRSVEEASKYPTWVKAANRFQGEGVTRSNQLSNQNTKPSDNKQRE